jgi:ABC-type enterochelin transport system substrate-binding protein
MSLMDWAATLASLSAFGAALVAATSWVLRNYLKNYVHELKPNGGSSMKDTINKIHAELTDLRISVARLEGRFTQHLEDGKG